ncbi:MAG TPA: hypothetical protein VHN37_07820 [Actinomycetota bacterium]|nr:hypothetical protein [Actinomycetota bacterium]
MLLFRSEEHVDRWIAGGRPQGATLTLEQQWRLATGWFRGRHLPGWRKRSAAEAEGVFRDAGLTGDFWALA